MKWQRLKELKNISAVRKYKSANVTLGVPFFGGMSYTTREQYKLNINGGIKNVSIS